MADPGDEDDEPAVRKAPLISVDVTSTYAKLSFWDGVDSIKRQLACRSFKPEVSSWSLVDPPSLGKQPTATPRPLAVNLKRKEKKKKVHPGYRRAVLINTWPFFGKHNSTAFESTRVHLFTHTLALQIAHC